MKHTTKHGHGQPHPPQHSKRRRKSHAFAVAAVIGLVSLAVFVTWTVLRRDTDTYLTKETNNSFDLQEVAPRAPVAPTIPTAPPQAVPSSLVAPIPFEDLAGAAPAKPAASRPPVVTAKAVRWARTHKVFVAFLKAPARYLTARSSNLASPKALKSFLADPKRVNAYLDSALVRVALNSPVVTKALLGDPGVVKAFMGSPAMQDESAVRALLTSQLFHKVMDCPGPQGALEDPSAIMKLVTNPATLRWLGENPQALSAISKAAPALASAAAPRLKGRR